MTTKDEEIIALAKEHKILGETFDTEYCYVAGLPLGTNGTVIAEEANILAFAKSIQDKQRLIDFSICDALPDHCTPYECAEAIRMQSPESDVG